MVNLLDSSFLLQPQFSSVQSLSCVRPFATPWTAARRASQSITNSRGLLKLMSIESVMPSNHLIFCGPDRKSTRLNSCVRLVATTWTALQASLSITNSQSLLKHMSIESVMPSNHLIFCRPLLLPPSIFPSIRDFSNESVLRIRWIEYWSFSFSISSSSEHPGLISFSWKALKVIL